VDVEGEAVLGVEAARLHHVPDQRIEHRQRQARHLDHRFVLRADRDGGAGGKGCGGNGESAARQRCH
jgi:hypothetical protein